MIVLIIFIVVSVIIVKAFKRTTKSIRIEKELFKQMLLNPSDATVRAYIPALNEFYDNSPTNIKLEMANMKGHKTRQVQGFYTIYKSKNVSSGAKEELKNCYILNGLLSMTSEDFSL